MHSKLSLSAFIAGLVFGTGLIISGMIDPNRVKAFLDVAGTWNPSLALVMGGAIAIAAPAFFIARQQKQAVLGGQITLPDTHSIDRKLIIGAMIFGLGWGLSGICPGPDLVLLGYGARGAFIFIIALIAGAYAANQFSRLPSVITPTPDG